MSNRSVNERITDLLEERAYAAPSVLVDFLSSEDMALLMCAGLGLTMAAPDHPRAIACRELLNEVRERTFKTYCEENWQSGEREFEAMLRDAEVDARIDERAA